MSDRPDLNYLEIYVIANCITMSQWNRREDYWPMA